MYRSIHVSYGMVNHLMRVVTTQALIRFQRIAVQRRLRLHVLADERLKVFLLSLVYNLRPNLPAAFQHGGNDCLALRTAAPPLEPAGLHVAVHVSRLGSDE